MTAAELRALIGHWSRTEREALAARLECSYTTLWRMMSGIRRIKAIEAEMIRKALKEAPSHG